MTNRMAQKPGAGRNLRSSWERPILVLGFMLAGCFQAHAQISPGALSEAHSELSGVGNCVKCHDVGKRAPVFKCQECHREIQRRLDENRGLHPSLVEADRTGRACAKCHSEHGGRNAGLIHWNPPQTNFDHRRTGYALVGRHAALTCHDCHKPSHIKVQVEDPAAPKNRDRTYLGLNRECAACHEDQHRGQLPGACETCHNTSRWQDALHFDHAKSRFPLEGPHEKADCRKCHEETAAAKPYRKYRGLAFEDCISCHTDPHRGAFQSACKSCHAVANWKPSGVSAVFDHARSRFPLAGKHSGLACKSCHKKGNFKQPVSHEKCADCHLPGPHKDQFSNRPGGGDCSSCHRVEGFKPSTFDKAQHRGSRFLLDGRHEEVRCDQCHIPKGPATTYRIVDTRCAACHADRHAGQFLSPPYEGQCELCHSVRGFALSSFTPARHQSTRFPLSGAHGAVVCSECHKRTPGTDVASLPVKYRFDDRTCSTCHRDFHRGQFAARMAQAGPDGVAKDCASCHNNISWRELSGFEHGQTRFALEGEHRQAACDRCHQRGEKKPDPGEVVFREAPRQCAACHEDRHGGQFEASGSTDCARCHVQQQWKPSTFAHDSGGGYALPEGHGRGRCIGCHPPGKGVEGKTATMYRGVPKTCSGCHRSREPERIGRSDFKTPPGGIRISSGAIPAPGFNLRESSTLWEGVTKCNE